MIGIWTLEGHRQDTNSVNVLVSRHSRIKWQGCDLTVTFLILLTAQVDSEDMTLIKTQDKFFKNFIFSLF